MLTMHAKQTKFNGFIIFPLVYKLKLIQFKLKQNREMPARNATV